MPNRNENNVIIGAPFDQAKEYFIEIEDGRYAFNMRKLFPERFLDGDELGNSAWDYDWAIDNTGSKWFPNEISIYPCHEVTQLIYDTARSPNNATLERLHQLTGWTIRNDFEESGDLFEGTFECCDGTCRTEDREYRPHCDICDTKKPQSEMITDDDGQVCKECQAEQIRRDYTPCAFCGMKYPKSELEPDGDQLICDRCIGSMGRR